MSFEKATIEVGDPMDIKENKVYAVLAYLLFFLPLIACPQSRFARYHANQGLILLIAAVGINIVTRIFSIIPLIGLLFLLLSWALSIALLVFMILGMVNAGSGQMKPLPLIGNFTILK